MRDLFAAFYVNALKRSSSWEEPHVLVVVVLQIIGKPIYTRVNEGVL